MITDVALAQVCAQAYGSSASWDERWEFEGTVLLHLKLEGGSVVVFRGTANAADWMRDAEAFPLWDPRIGFVHAGFMVGMNEALEAVSAIEGPMVLTGHSLGGARARILAALMAHAGKPVAKCVVFGSPRPGFANLARVLQKTKTPLASYRNRNDPVPLVPFMGGLYQHPDAWIAVNGAPGEEDLNPLRDHEIARYITALSAIAAPPVAEAAKA